MAFAHATHVTKTERYERPFLCVSPAAYTWLMAFVVAMLPLLGFGAYVHEGPGFWCSVQWEEKSLIADVYIVFMFGTSFVWPLFLIVFSVTGALMQIRKVYGAIGKHAPVQCTRTRSDKDYDVGRVLTQKSTAQYLALFFIACSKSGAAGCIDC